MIPKPKPKLLTASPPNLRAPKNKITSKHIHIQIHRNYPEKNSRHSSNSPVPTHPRTRTTDDEFESVSKLSEVEVTIHQVVLLLSLAFGLTWTGDCWKWNLSVSLKGRSLIKHIQADIPSSKATPRNLQQWKKQNDPSSYSEQGILKRTGVRGRAPPEGRIVSLPFSIYFFWCYYSRSVTCAYTILCTEGCGGSWRCRRKTLVNVRL